MWHSLKYGIKGLKEKGKIIMKEVIKKWWFWVIVGFVLIGLASNCSDNEKELVAYTDHFIIQVGSKNITVNDMELTLDAPVRELEWHSYMPLRFFLDWFGAEDVTYDKATEVITFKLTRFQELDPKIIAKYDSQKKLTKPVEPKKELAKQVEPPKKAETPSSIKEPAKDKTISIEEAKILVLNILKDSYADIATCGINEELKAFTITPLDKDFAIAAVLAKEGDVDLKKIWDNSLNDYKSISINIYKMLPGYSFAVLNPVSTERMLIAVMNGIVLIDAVNNP